MIPFRFLSFCGHMKTKKENEMEFENVVFGILILLAIAFVYFENEKRYQELKEAQENNGGNTVSTYTPLPYYYTRRNPIYDYRYWYGLGRHHGPRRHGPWNGRRRFGGGRGRDSDSDSEPETERVIRVEINNQGGSGNGNGNGSGSGSGNGSGGTTGSGDMTGSGNGTGSGFANTTINGDGSMM